MGRLGVVAGVGVGAQEVVVVVVRARNVGGRQRVCRLSLLLVRDFPLC